MEGRVWPHVVEVLAWYRLGFMGSDIWCGCSFWFFEMGVVLVRLPGLPSYSEATKQPPCKAETGCQPTKTFGRISCPWCARAVCTWKFGASFLYDLVSGSLFLGIWVLHVDYGTLDSSGDLSGGAILGSTVDTGFASVLCFWTNFTQFLRSRGLGS